MRRSFLFVPLLLSLLSCSLLTPLEDRLLSADDRVRTKALRKLSELPPEKQTLLSIPLAAALKNPESRVVNRAVEALVTIGSPAVENVRVLLADPDVFTRLSAISVLGRIGKPAETTVPDLALRLEDAHPLVRDEAAFALGQMGRAAEPAGPALLRAFKQASDDDAKTTIVEALKKIGLKPPSIS